MTHDIAIVGGGIVGLTTALAITDANPDCSVAVLEKEDGWARHQTGHNSGVIHSGIYYPPGSFKATMARQGGQEMMNFCERHGLQVTRSGKIIVATEPEELPRLEKLRERGVANGLSVHPLAREQIREHEPHVRGLAGLHVPATGTCDFGAVARKLADILDERGVRLMTSTRVTGFAGGGREVVVKTDRGDVAARRVANCAGLYSDRLARCAGYHDSVRIVPFRGEYFELAEDRQHLVRSLVYPVPDPAFPFLGVHLTRMIGGGVHIGPNAVLAMAREGYRKSSVDWAGVRDILTNPGLRVLARSYWRQGGAEMLRSMIKPLFVRAVRRLVPEVRSADLVAAPSGVRAQAIRSDGTLVDDFAFAEDDRFVHLLNAPSPAATASFPIGREIARRCLGKAD
jgi:malate dehydrogenase (quinone)/L-2-hydroxyglutarate oxidase